MSRWRCEQQVMAKQHVSIVGVGGAIILVGGGSGRREVERVGWGQDTHSVRPLSTDTSMMMWRSRWPLRGEWGMGGRAGGVTTTFWVIAEVGGVGVGVVIEALQVLVV
jgi:hypothetical protein